VWPFLPSWPSPQRLERPERLLVGLAVASPAVGTAARGRCRGRLDLGRGALAEGVGTMKSGRVTSPARTFSGLSSVRTTPAAARMSGVIVTGPA